MSGIYALYADPDSAQGAVNRLRAAGMTDHDITVISSEPFEEYQFSRRDKPTWLYWLSGLGGVMGLLVGYLLTSMAQRAWPLPTGGMPIVPLWTNVIVMFEQTMLGGILTAVIGLLVTARLPGRLSKRLYDPAVSEGKILVGVERPPEGSIEGLRCALEIDAVLPLNPS